MEDKHELRHADAVIDDLATNLRDRSSGAKKRVLDRFLNLRQQTKVSEFSTVYLACFSKARDKDSLWRKFQREGSGVCLGIRVLQEKPVADDRLRGGLGQVVYSEQESRESLRSSFDHILREHQMYVAGHRQDEGWAMEQALTILLASLAVQEIRTKKEEFAEEEEWRYALFPRFPEKKSLDEKSTNGRRYVERHMRSQGRPLALAEVILGSKQVREGRHEAAAEEARRILSEAGYRDPCAEMPEIVPSSCSLDVVQPPASHASS